MTVVHQTLVRLSVIFSSMRFKFNFTLVCVNFFMTYISNTIITGKFSVTSVVNRLLDQEHPYQIMIFLTDSVKSITMNKVLSPKGIPSFNLESRNLKFTKQMTTEIKKSIHMSLIIICIDKLNKANHYMDFIVQQIPIYQRPKCLFLLLDQNNDLTQNYKNIFENAWAHKILDASIINMNESNKNSTFIRYFNPFDSTFTKKIFNLNVPIFPDKFKRMKNYPLNVTFSSQDLIEKAARNPYKTEYVMNGDYTVRYMLKSTNFVLESVEGDDRTVLTYSFIDPNSWFSNVYSNVHGVMLRLRSLTLYANLSDLLILPSEQYCLRHVVLVPKQRVMTFPAEILIYFFFIPGIIFTFLFTIRKVDKEYENVLSLTRLLLGQCVDFKFRKIANRIIFLFMVLVYTISSNDIYTIIVSKRYYTDELVIKDLDDLAKSKLPIYTSQRLNLVYFNNTNDETFKLLDQKIQYDPKCTVNMVKLRNRICIINSVDAKAAVSKYRDSDGSPMLYIAATYSCDEFYYTFEPASPYTKRFMSVVRRVHASGLLKHDALLYFNFDPSKFKNFEIQDNNDKDDISTGKLLLVLLFGDFIAFCAFTVEFILLPNMRYPRLIKVNSLVKNNLKSIRFSRK